MEFNTHTKQKLQLESQRIGNIQFQKDIRLIQARIHKILVIKYEFNIPVYVSVK